MDVLKMKLEKLLNNIFVDTIEKLSTIVDPLIKANILTWEKIETIIHEWFDTNNVLSWSIKYVNELNENGIFFNNQDGNTVTAEFIVKFLKRRNITDNVKKGILEHYHEKMHNIDIFSCPTGARSFVETDKNKKITRFGCEMIKNEE
ncbi:hypothetical protein LCGC14_1934310 [marine sediment metagenome]|uniref:Uncharacterized protein n=1 Tax=marine sediment metagenome TaxID=412755 RepID=A0A0F9FM68_9ZZZZ